MNQQPAFIPVSRGYDLTRFMTISLDSPGLPVSDPRLQDPLLKRAACCPGQRPYQDRVRDRDSQTNPVTQEFERCQYPETSFFLTQQRAMLLALGAVGFGNYEAMRLSSPVLSALTN